MMVDVTVPEIDILISACTLLYSQGWLIKCISIARGQGINSLDDRNKLHDKLSELQISYKDIEFVHNGPDIIALKDSIIWKIECKGIGQGKSQTLRNNFDRSLSSAVSYYDKPDNLQLGLALPRSAPYISLIESKIPQALRRAINLWLLLYNIEEKTMDTYDPTEVLWKGL
jgi:hypothetical protein